MKRLNYSLFSSTASYKGKIVLSVRELLPS